MVGAMIVCLGVILAFVVFRELNRTDATVDPEAVDHLEAVQAAQDADIPVAYPRMLPDGWIATRAVFDTVEQQRVWALSLLTDDTEFVGVRQGPVEVEDMVAEYVDEDAEEGETVTLDSPLAREWQAFTDDGGDYALVAQLGEDTVLVFGSPGESVVRDLAESLVTEPLA